ncbi:hypothetical protein LX36DRAFT_732977 [Colletotrichum falcatum]|nr:hypothetical protein LX36DRAFT_732977 [Colletotrichum falcatum]
MVGQISYTTDQILFVLEQVLADKKRDIILYEYQKKFNKSLSASQLRYIKSKYGHDPEFGTALINRKLPEDSGNRRMAMSPSKGLLISQRQTIQHVQLRKETPNSPVVHMPQLNSDRQESLPVEYKKLPNWANNTINPFEKPNKSSICSSWDERTRLHPQSQLQHQEFPQCQSHVSAPEPTGTYWFDRYVPAAYETPYGSQPVLYFNNKLLFSSTTQRRRLEEPRETLPSSPARHNLPIDEFNGLTSLPAAVYESTEEPEAKRLELQKTGFSHIITAESAQTSMIEFTHQAMEQGNTTVCDVAPSEEPVAPVDSDKTDDTLYINDGKKGYFQWSQFQADASLTFSGAEWDRIIEEMEFGLQSNHQTSNSFEYHTLLESYDPTLDLVSGPVIQDASQALVERAIVETDTTVFGCDGESQGPSASEIMAVPEQTGVGDGLDFLNSLDAFDDTDWSLDPLLGDDFTPDAHLNPVVDPALGVEDQTQSSHFY